MFQSGHHQREWSTAISGLTPDHAAQHMALIAPFLYGQEYQRVEEEATKKALSSALASRYRTDRFRLAEALKAQHAQQLKEEVSLMKKKVDDVWTYVRGEVQNLKPKALEELVKRYQAALKKGNGTRRGARGGGLSMVLAQENDDDDNDEGDGEEEEEEEEDDEVLMMKAMDPYGFSPSVMGKKRKGITTATTPGEASPVSPPTAERPRKQKKKKKITQKTKTSSSTEERQDALLIAMMGGNADNKSGSGGVDLLGSEDEEALLAEALAALNQEALKQKLKHAMEEAQREYEEDRNRKWEEELRQRLVLAVNQVKQDLEVDFEARLEEEKERVRVMTEVAGDQEKKELEEQIRAECAAEIAEVMRSVGLGD